MRNLRSKIAMIMLLSFPYLAAIGIFQNASNAIIISFFVLTLILEWNNVGRLFNLVRTSKVMLFWCLYLVVVIVSTVLLRRLADPHIIFIDLLVFMSVVLLMLDIKLGDYLQYFKWSVLIVAWTSLFGSISGVGLFDFLKSNITLNSLDSAVGGLSGAFEYRHYYGIFLVVALLIQYFHKSNKFVINLLNLSILGINLVLTYTRSDWIAFAAVFVIIASASFSRGIKLTYIQVAVSVILIGILGYVAFYSQIHPVLMSVMKRITDIFNTNDFGGARAYSMTAGVAYIFTHWYTYIWIGGGTGFALAWLTAFPFDGWWTAAIDCQYVSTFMETGIVGTVLILLIIIWGFRYGASEKSSQIQKTFALGFVAIAISVFFYDVIGTPTSVFVLWNVLICGMAITQQSTDTYDISKGVYS